MAKKKNTILDIKTLQSQLSDRRKELLNLRFQKTSGQQENTSQFKKVKKKIASLLTQQKKLRNSNA